MTKTFIIAEAGVNHNGSLEMAKELVDVAKAAGADAVKFQTFKAENLVTSKAQKAQYQKETTGNGESQFKMLKKLELDEQGHAILIDYCRDVGIEFLSTPFDSDSLTLLADKYSLRVIKIPSGEITNGPFLLEIARLKKPVILSTGMSSLAEVETALSLLAFGFTDGDKPATAAFKEAYLSKPGQQMLFEKVTLLHCTTEYPTPFTDVNLKAMDTLKSAFNLPVGYSDHTPGISIPIAAVARGAVLIEKHFTLDKNLPGPDHRASLEGDELKNMVRSIREVELGLGSSLKAPAASELKNMASARKSLIAARKICSGETFTGENVAIKRPGIGISPMDYWSLLGKKAQRDYTEEEFILE
ncbi:N-acetylneuraminate synthase [Candidatus Riflebacteria bacterium]